ncbi:MAG: hypothetical protein SO046_01245 [Actinomyces urogenitalis]|uniref:hypothetical protein n=1 Tax=Actinomyces urogenitalis TaxID=103621 RepID=UPI002A83B4AE|nr:hypothetical protein [Actinomyces urogenitalis]MDY3677833.1 hypothetical protein [Actinomyces urogenitalis]
MTAQNPAAAPASLTVEEIEAQLAERRRKLSHDLEDLGFRLAPTSLKAQVRQAADEAKVRVRAGLAELKVRAQDAADAARDKAEDAVDELGSSGQPGAASPADRARRLLDDAADGDPRSLAIVTGAALALAGLSLYAVVKALRS